MAEARNVRLEIRLSAEEHANYERLSREEGHPSIASWLRGLANAHVRKQRPARANAESK